MHRITKEASDSKHSKNCWRVLPPSGDGLCNLQVTVEGKRCCDNLNSSENNSISQALLYHYRVHNIQFILDVYAHIYTCTYTNVHTYVHTQTHTHTVLPTFIMEGNARFDFQVSENKDVTFFLTDSQSPWGSLNFQLRIAPKPFLQTCSQEEV